MNIANIGFSMPVYAEPALAEASLGAAPTEAAAREFDAMIFRLLLQSVNLFGTEQQGTPWAGLWQGVVAHQWAQELAAQHLLSFGTTLLSGEEEGQL